MVLVLALATAGWYVYRWPWYPAGETQISSAAPALASPTSGIVTPEPTPAPVPTATPAATAVAPIQHVVEQGDSLLYIAIKYGTTVEAITGLNGITDPDALLNIGQVLLIPVTAPTAVPFPTAIPAGLRAHTVQRHETLSDIAAKYDTTVEAVATQNGLEEPYLLQIGQVLLIPK